MIVKVDPWSPCVDSSSMTTFFNNKNIWNALNIGNKSTNFVWKDCVDMSYFDPSYNAS